MCGQMNWEEEWTEMHRKGPKPKPKPRTKRPQIHCGNTTKGMVWCNIYHMRCSKEHCLTECEDPKRKVVPDASTLS